MNYDNNSISNKTNDKSLTDDEQITSDDNNNHNSKTKKIKNKKTK